MRFGSHVSLVQYLHTRLAELFNDSLSCAAMLIPGSHTLSERHREDVESRTARSNGGAPRQSMISESLANSE